MAQELIHRNQTEQTRQSVKDQANLENPAEKPRNTIRYTLHVEPLAFLFIGIAIATLFFTTFPVHSSPSHQSHDHLPVQLSESSSEPSRRRVLYEGRQREGKVPMGLSKKRQRILVTGGAGFVGSHLVDRLMERGDNVIVIDNFFTGRKENVMQHFGNLRFELIRHDVVEPIMLEVDQIYHLACPASPVHYKFNPVKTIISFLFFVSSSS